MSEFLSKDQTSLQQIEQEESNERKRSAEPFHFRFAQRPERQAEDTLSPVNNSLAGTLRFTKPPLSLRNDVRFRINGSHYENFKHYFKISFYIENVYKKVDHQRKYEYLFKNEPTVKSATEIIHSLLKTAFTKNFFHEKGLLDKPGIEVFEDFYKIFFYKNGCKFFESLLICYLTKVNVFNACGCFDFPNSATYAGSVVNLLLKNRSNFGQKSHMFQEVNATLLSHFEFINFAFIEAYRLRILSSQAMESYHAEFGECIFLQKTVSKAADSQRGADTKGNIAQLTSDPKSFFFEVSEYDYLMLETFCLTIEFFEFSQEILEQTNPFCIKILQANLFEKTYNDCFRNRILCFLTKFFDVATEVVLIRTIQSCEMILDLKEFYIGYKKASLCSQKIEGKNEHVSFLDGVLKGYVEMILYLPIRRNLEKLTEHFKMSVSFLLLTEVLKKETEEPYDFYNYLLQNFFEVQPIRSIEKENERFKCASGGDISGSEAQMVKSKIAKRASEIRLSVNSLNNRPRFRY